MEDFLISATNFKRVKDTKIIDFFFLLRGLYWLIIYIKILYKYIFILKNEELLIPNACKKIRRKTRA